MDNSIVITSLDNASRLSIMSSPSSDLINLSIIYDCDGGYFDLNKDELLKLYSILFMFKCSIIKNEKFIDSLNLSSTVGEIVCECTALNNELEYAYIAYDVGIEMFICYVSVNEINKLLKFIREILNLLWV